MFRALRYYVLVDHKTRFRNNMIGVAVAALFYMQCLATYTDAVAVKVSLGVLLVSYMISTLLYVRQHRPAEIGQRPNEEDGAQLSSRRKLLGSLVWLLTLVFAGVGTPILEAAVVNRRLREVMEGEPTEEKTAELAQIMTEAEKHNLHVSPRLIAEAANQFASYRSALLISPVNLDLFVTLHAHPDNGIPFDLNVACVQGKTGGGARLHGISSPGAPGFGYGFDVGNCSDVAVMPAPLEPVILFIDNLDCKNVTFLNWTLNYNGGKVTLDNVRFVNCVFQIPAAHARNRNVLQFLTAALTGQPMHLELNA